MPTTTVGSEARRRGGRRNARLRSISALLLLVTLTAGACSSDDPAPEATATSIGATTVDPGSTDPGATTSPADTSLPDTVIDTVAPTSEPTTTVPDTIPEPSTDELPAGDVVAIIKELGEAEFVEGQAQVPVTFDVVQMLTGQDAIDAAVADGAAEDCNGEPCVPNDYYIVNDNPRLRTVLVIADADITVNGCDGGCPGPITADIEALRGLQDPLFRITAFGTGDSARITALHQIFVP